MKMQLWKREKQIKKEEEVEINNKIYQIEINAKKKTEIKKIREIDLPTSKKRDKVKTKKNQIENNIKDF